MMEIFRILDELELMIKGSKKVPLSNGKVMIESHRFLDRVDRLRAILPEELETARLIMSEKERIVKEACAQADEYLEQSKDHVARMVDDNEITRNAMQMGEEIVAKAEEMAREIRRDVNEYADGVLSHMEIVLKKGLEAISQGKQEIRDSQEEEY
ncbi:MAG: ATPase [Syntrophomonadaceae bacterium]|jgi:BMFP domain-containing protein YqiC|nr:ATPase [Syntrophomonadaceae bacterium]NLX03289.1 ATPase [Syntrophomonadaceae bacterium]